MPSASIDTNSQGGRFSAARRRIDTLQNELDHGRISTAAFMEGRKIQAELERDEVSGGSVWPTGDIVDASRQPDAAMVHAIDAAKGIALTMGHLSRTVGPVDARLLLRVLGGRMGFEACAEMEGKTGTRGAGYYATRFRDALEELARPMKAQGAPARTIADKYAVAAEALKRRASLNSA